MSVPIFPITAGSPKQSMKSSWKRKDAPKPYLPKYKRLAVKGESQWQSNESKVIYDCSGVKEILKQLTVVLMISRNHKQPQSNSIQFLIMIACSILWNSDLWHLHFQFELHAESKLLKIVIFIPYLDKREVWYILLAKSSPTGHFYYHRGGDFIPIMLPATRPAHQTSNA